MKKWMAHRRLAAVVCAAASAGTIMATATPPAAAATTTTVVPNANATVEGNSENAFPFNCAVIHTKMRYQEVYSGTEVGSGLLSQLAFRPDATSGAAFGPTTIPNVTITLSTTSKAVGALDTTFANNVGPDVTTVFSGNLTLQSAATGGPPRNFDILIPLQRAFNFNSAGGNLLLDLTIPTCVSTTAFDSVTPAAPSSSRIYTDNETLGPTATFVSPQGLVTQFTSYACTQVVSSTSGSPTVPSSGTTCFSSATVGGTINVPHGASLVLLNSTVAGNVNASGAASITICGSHINGSVTISGTTGPVVIGDGGSCASNVIGGNTTLASNAGSTKVDANTIHGNLACFSNAAITNDGKPNTVSGARSGQCASF